MWEIRTLWVWGRTVKSLELWGTGRFPRRIQVEAADCRQCAGGKEDRASLRHFYKPAQCKHVCMLRYALPWIILQSHQQPVMEGQHMYSPDLQGCLVAFSWVSWLQQPPATIIYLGLHLCTAFGMTGASQAALVILKGTKGITVQNGNAF